MSPGVRSRFSTPDERDALLRDLVERWQREGRDGPSTSELFGSFLPALLSGFQHEFPSIAPEDALFYATEVLCDSGIPADVPACAWLLTVVRNGLRTWTVTQRHWLSERDVRDGVWAHLKKNQDLGEGTPLVSVYGQECEWPPIPLAMTPMPAGSSPLWQELRALLVRAGWDRDVAEHGLQVIEQRATQHLEEISFGPEPGPALSRLETNRVLSCVPRGHKRALVDFVCSERGYLWGRLHGISPVNALALPGVREALESLVWNKARPKNARTRSYASRNVHSCEDIPA
ncbi:hypothetical protein [Arthrobacter bambusae]|uniref:hypothetical protein n=1 Tax=Arthrobacter bambusae TaxID=1338426 RepID=UPI0027822D71|nr:hypothetical protein [Arthrobacter bambusae]MDQ0210781.1 hypothetical protein [Arthrobacter bambusae]MDQ0235454.1 hypothetical protein [Arthrobacter bambusae]